MAKYKMSDFHMGDQVYHLSNTNLKMVAIEINEDMNEIKCRWVDKGGKTQIEFFMPEELGKAKDLGPRITSIRI